MVAGELLPAFALIARGFVHEGVCPDGRYVMQILGEERPALVVEGGAVSIDGFCPPVAARIGISPRGTTVLAEWPACSGRLRGRVRLRAVIDVTCTGVTGVMRWFRTGMVRRFAAGRLSVCGNGVLENFESCDDHNIADGDCCTAECHRGFAPGCGDQCLTDAECGADAYCARAFDECDGAGTCRARPLACTDLYDPTCGCDGKTYANRCAAAAAGVGLLDLVHCEKTCGTIAGLECSAGEFCDFPARACRAVDLGGKCAVVPTACLLNVDPVCGCNGITYPNDCARRARRAQLAHEGRCSPQ